MVETYKVLALIGSCIALCAIIFLLRCVRCGSGCKNSCAGFRRMYYPSLKYPYSLPKLGYDYNALEPHIDAQTMQIHHTKHHQAYIDNLNKALEAFPAYQSKTLEDLLCSIAQLPEELRQKVQDHGGGHFNHTFFWVIMGPQAGGEPTGDLAAQITQDFGSFVQFKDKFDKAAQTKFGSGWAWLCMDQAQKLVVVATSNQDNPFSQGLFPLMGIDVWEHAYYLKYQNKRMDYVSAWWQVINWQQVAQHYALAKQACTKKTCSGSACSK